MSFEQLIEKLIVALDKNTAAHVATAGKAAPAAPAKGATVTPIKPGIKPGPGEPTAAVIEFDAVKIAAGRVVDAHGKPFAKKIIKDVGEAVDLATVKPNKYAALMAAFEKSLAPKEDAAEEEDEDDDGL